MSFFPNLKLRTQDTWTKFRSHPDAQFVADGVTNFWYHFTHSYFMRWMVFICWPLVLIKRALVWVTLHFIVWPIAWIIALLFRLVWILVLLIVRPIGRGAMHFQTVRQGVAYGQAKAREPLYQNMAKVVLILVIFFGAIFGFEAFMNAFAAFMIHNSGPPTQTVSTTHATSEPWQTTFRAVGSLRAINGADLSSEESGIVEAINFQSGDEVPEGTVLITLRAEDDIAKLESLKATARLAEINFKRDQLQFQAQAVSQATLDSDAATLDNDNALAAQQQAIVDKKTIRAPFAGKLGIRAVDIGQYLNAGTAVVTLQALDPIYVDFYLPQQQVGQIKPDDTVQITIDAFPGASFTGKVSAVNPNVDLTSRNVQVRATIPNADHKLLPGMYGHVSVNIGQPTPQITVPDTALTYNPYGTYIYRVAPEPEKTTWITPYWKKIFGDHRRLIATQSPVTTGDMRGDQVEILQGVEKGDEVVIAGQLKLFNGAPVIINNDPKYLPTNDANPHPQEQ